MSVVFDRTPPASRHIKIFDMATYDVKFSQELHESASTLAHADRHNTCCLLAGVLTSACLYLSLAVRCARDVQVHDVHCRE